MADNTTAPLVSDRIGAITRITLNRPEKLNALTTEMLDLLERCIGGIASDRECRGVVIAAAGEKAFCAGADINAWAELPPIEMWRFWTQRGHEVFERIERLPQPVIVLVDGIAYGGGLELALAGDLIVATERSRFAFPEVGIATVPGWGGTARLAERVGISRAKQMILTGEPVPGTLAEEWGLVNTLFPDRRAMERGTDTVMERIAGNSPVAVTAAKQLLRTYQHSRWNSAAMESLAGGLAALTIDGAEGIAAYREKRTPLFRGE